MKKRPAGTRLQSVLFPSDTWTPKRARAWLERHGFRANIDKVGRYYRAKQRDAKAFRRSSFHFFNLSAKRRVSAIVGTVKP